MAKEKRYRVRKFERYVAVLYGRTENRPDPRCPRQGHGGDQQLSVRVMLAQMVDQRNSGLYFTDRHRMNPDTTFQAWKTEAEALSEVCKVVAITDATK